MEVPVFGEVPVPQLQLPEGVDAEARPSLLPHTSLPLFSSFTWAHLSGGITLESIEWLYGIAGNEHIRGGIT